MAKQKQYTEVDIVITPPVPRYGGVTLRKHVELNIGTQPEIDKLMREINAILEPLEKESEPS